MVKLYERFEQDRVFGIIAGLSNVVWLPHTNLTGRALVGALEAIEVWDIKTGELIDRLVDGLVPGALNAPTMAPPPVVTAVCFHHSTNLVGAGYSDGSVKLWDLTSTLVVVSFNGHRSAVTQLQFDASGTRLVSGSADTSIIVWDLIGEEGLFRLKGHKGPITGLALVGEDNYLLSSSKDGMVKVWEMALEQCLETHLGHANECWGLAVYNDLVLTSGKDNKVWALDLKDEDTKLTERGVFAKQSQLRTNLVSFHQDQFMIQNADKTVELMRIRSEDEIKKGVAKRTKRLKEKGMTEEEIADSLKLLEMLILITDVAIIRALGKIRAASYTANGNVLINSQNLLELWQVTGKKKDVTVAKSHTVDLPGHRTDIRATDISSDAKLVVTASNGELKVWNIATAKVVRSFTTQGAALCCKFLPGNTLVVVGYKNGVLELFDLASLAVVDLTQAHGTEEEGAAVWAMDITADGKTLVTGGNDKQVKFWEFKVEENYLGYASLAFKHKQTLEMNEDILAVKISPDTRLLAVSLLNNNIQVVFFDSLKLYLTLYGHKLPVLALDISHDSKLLISSSADKNIKIWGLDFGDCHKSIFAHQDSVMNVKFLGETHHFFSSGKDGLVKYWDGDKFECIQKLAAHQLEVWCLVAAPSGDLVVSASHDHSVRVWKLFGDQVFIEEEKEKEIDELYEQELLEDPHAKKNEDDEDGAERVQKQTVDSLKAGERVMEALDIGYDSVVAEENGEAYTNAILIHMKQTGPQHVLEVIRKVKPSQLDDALLVLPFLYTLKLLKMIEVWTKDQQPIGTMQLICRVLYFVVRTNARELIQQKDSKIRDQLLNVKSQIRDRLGAVTESVGENLAAMKFVKQQWALNHEVEFGEEVEAKGMKRVFTTV